MDSLLENLNPEQLEAVKAVHNGPVLVTAGAGTGKTTVLIAAMTLLLMRSENALPPLKQFQLRGFYPVSPCFPTLFVYRF